MTKFQPSEPVSVFPITQATTAVFPDLYFRQILLFFIQSGSKRVIDAEKQEIIAETGDILIFPSETMVTMENRPIMENDYRALGIAYSNDSVLSVFSDKTTSTRPEIQLVRKNTHNLSMLVTHIEQTLKLENLDEAIRTHRLLEPLVWLKSQGLQVPIQIEESILSSVRKIIEADLSYSWTSKEVASQLAISEPTMRRRLSKNQQGFAKILLNTRLEYGLSLLQTTTASISEIAYESGFKTPSHFADVFKKRFGIQPKNIRIKQN